MRRFVYLILVEVIVISCNIPPNIEEPEEDNQINSFNPSSSVFEGEWTWLETKGEGIAGPYILDSISVGYSWKFKFTESNGQGGILLIYKNKEKDASFNYTYTVSDNPREQRLLLNDSAGDNFLWEMAVVDEQLHLYLRNVEDCCDNTFEHHFLLTKAPNL